ncbi:uncharacterized protein LOC126374110 [Pectinophora gossypiella]|uniref:uncharacterized protein LOC126374110 n=1 Tax=Pectinophora gossypiella TaxID=13191 RepID=UPI00214EA462|nr:uncharacterized protein LOC126374110 [Pectinophora gossypiella]
MVSKIALALCVLVAVASAVPAAPGGAWGPAAGGVNPWIPPWISAAPWYPQWTPCTTVGSSCLDCNTKLVCTKIGGIQRACTDPTLPYCNLGACSATPTAECAPIVPAVPAAGAA